VDKHHLTDSVNTYGAGDNCDCVMLGADDLFSGADDKLTV